MEEDLGLLALDDGLIGFCPTGVNAILVIGSIPGVSALMA